MKTRLDLCRFPLSLVILFLMACASSPPQFGEDPSALVLIEGVSYAPVALDRQAHFVSTESEAVVLEPGRYLVEVTGTPPLAVRTQAGDGKWSIDAVTGAHDESLQTAVAESIPGEPDDPHLVLFLPDGKTIDAVGTYSGVTERAARTRRSIRRRPVRRTSSTSVVRTYVASPFTVSVDRFSVEPAQPMAGQTLSVVMRVRASGSGTKSVPWRIKRGNVVLAQGTRANVQAGSSFTVSAHWNAVESNMSFHGFVDPNNTLNESQANRSNNSSSRVVKIFPDWAGVFDLTWAATKTAINAWRLQTGLRNIIINGPTALCMQACMTGPALRPNLQAALSGKVPDQIASRLARAISDAWAAWQSGVTVPSLPWYPAFTTYPGPQAPPMPNLPTPLASLVSTRIFELSPPQISSRLKGRLGSSADQPGANQAISLFATKFAHQFSMWSASAQVTLVMGRGPVPTYNPPHFPIGPVVGGTILPPSPSHLQSAPNFAAGVP
ncbi:MAG: hypothetical protein ABGY42_03255 [bacterium]